MPSTYIALTSGAYQARSIDAGAQRCVNLIPESSPPTAQEPYAWAHNPSPGLTVLSVAPSGNVPIRGLYTSSQGLLYAVANQSLYYIDSTWTWNYLGTMIGSIIENSASLWYPALDVTQRINPVTMIDDGTSLLLADASSDGWTLNLPTNTSFTRINSLNQTVTGTISNPTVTSNSTIIIDTVNVTLGLTDTSLSGTINAINGAAIPNISASANATNCLVITDSTGTEIVIGPGTANNSVGLVDGVYGVPDAGGWLGAKKLDFISTYFVAVNPNGTTFYCSQSESTLFDALDFVEKSGKADPIQTIVVTHGVLWLIGTQTTEIWYLSGGGGSGALSVNTFPFESFPNTLLQHGCAAVYSLAQADGIIYFLSTDTSGKGIVLAGSGAQAQLERISTFAIEQEISKILDISQARGSCYQMQGHQFYVLNFPICSDGSGDQTWCYDATTGQWHQRVWMDNNGVEHRWRGDFCTAAYGIVVCADWETGNLYQIDQNNYTDNGQPIKRLRSFPHQVDLQANRRVMFNQIIVNMSVGGAASSGDIQQTAIDCSFSAPNNTPLQNYAGTGDIGAIFTEFPDATTNGIIYQDSFSGANAGTTAYSASGLPLSPDYIVSWSAAPSSYENVATSSIYSIARATGNTIANAMGYQTMVSGNGIAYNLSLYVLPNGTMHSVTMGTISSGSYVIGTTLTGTSISISAQRSTDNLWLNQSGSWQSSQAIAINIQDATYANAGDIIIGGDWAGPPA